MTSNNSAWVVVKFGGTSVSSLARWQNIKTIVKQHLAAGLRPLVVCSAIAGVSTQLENVLLNFAEVERSNTLLQEVFDKYRELSKMLQVDADEELEITFSSLSQLIEGVRLTGEVTPRIHARVLSFGELLLTRLGVKYLQQQGVDVCWQDAREWLVAEKHSDFRHPDAYLNARCHPDRDEALIAKLAGLAHQAVITQGFVAANEQGETVLLGRGGSDSSASYFSAKIAATGCEIWTDVPGIYTANPKNIPEARLLTSLAYDEAQEIASMGAKVLHPKCIAPVRQAEIPLYVKFTPEPDRVGTKISEENLDKRSQIKSILTKHNLILITIETFMMWQQVGFLAEVSQVFKRHGVSIDLISTSESSVTVSLDADTKVQDPRVLDALLAELNQFARAKVIMPCASVSLVGKNIRSILHQLGSVFSVFEEQKIYLLSQAANDLNLTFVVDEEQAQRLASKLHHLLIEQQATGDCFYLSWQEEFGSQVEQQAPWWVESREQLLKLAQERSPLYLYSESCLRDRAETLKRCDAIDRVYYSMKANNQVDVLKLFYKLGLGFECVSLEELTYLLTLFPRIDRKRISFTPNFAPRSEYEKALALGVNVTLDSSYPFYQWAEIFSGKEVLIRVDLGKGSGHHKYVVTGGDQSKFGIPLNELNDVLACANQHNIKIIGLHSHSGSGILNALHWQGVCESLLGLLPKFEDVKILNLGGGLGIAERANQTPLDMEKLNQSLKTLKLKHPTLQMWMEPGRFLVAESGVLLARVTQVKTKAGITFVGVDTGMNSLIRPALYGSYHEIVNLTKYHQPAQQTVNIVGPICESGDTLGYSRKLPVCEEGDILLIANVGAYGHCMSSHYNMRAPAQESLL